MTRARGSLSRRTMLLAGIGTSLGIVATRVFAQRPAGTETSATGNTVREDGSMNGKTALVTGSTDGLGRAVALQLGALGATVIVHGRNRQRGEQTVADIEANGGRAVFYPADFAALDEVRALADAIHERHDRLDLLINNAGIWTDGSDERRTSADGYELVFAVNYLAGYVLTHRLLPLLERSAPARIVNVSSLAQQPIAFDDVMLEREFSASRAYAQSKLAQVLFTIDLAEQLEGTGVTANSLHPATLMNTTMVELAGAAPRSTVEEGAAAVLQLVASPELDGRSGLFFNGLREAQADAQAYDEQARARLRALSVELTGEGRA
jgi:NAD(P)-dependent dehydrogenase (short-subunit alcohol dehydrogenase family)